MKKKRIISIALSVVLVVTMCGASAYAVDRQTGQNAAKTQTESDSLKTASEVINTTVGENYVILSWKGLETLKAEDYSVYKNGTDITKNVTVNVKTERNEQNVEVYSCSVKVDGLEADTSYDFKIIPSTKTTVWETTVKTEAAKTETPEDNPEENSEDNTVVSSKDVPEYLPDVANVKTLPGHQRIKISWNKLEVTVSGSKKEVDRYIVKRSANQGKSYVDYCTVTVNNGTATASGSIKSVKKTETGYYVEDRDVGDGLIDYNGKWGRNGGTYKYKVIAQKDYSTSTAKVVAAQESEESAQESEVAAQESLPAEQNQEELETAGNTVTVSSNEATAKAPSDACVRTSYVKLKLRTARTLTSHDKKKITKTFSGTIYTCSFGIGQYMFAYNDHMFWLNRISTKNQSTGYTKKAIYTDAAEYFVNSRPKNSSKTNKLIWVSTYTQRLYIFTRASKNSKWVLSGKCKAGWSVCTGRSSSPTIRTIDPKSSNLDSGRKIGKIKSISKKLSSRHGIPWWNCFSSYNAIHGKRAKWNINSTPRSGGCVRNTNDHAKWIYYNCGKGTGVILF